MTTKLTTKIPVGTLVTSSPSDDIVHTIYGDMVAEVVKVAPDYLHVRFPRVCCQQENTLLLLPEEVVVVRLPNPSITRGEGDLGRIYERLRKRSYRRTRGGIAYRYYRYLKHSVYVKGVRDALQEVEASR